MEQLRFDDLPGAVQDLLAKVDYLMGLIQEKGESNNSQHPEVMNTIQVAEYLTLSVSSINRKVQNSTMPHTKVDGRTIFRKKDIDDWLTENTLYC